MSRTVSARISNEMHGELRERCNRAGCTMNDWLEASIKYLFTGSSEFDFGDPEYEEEDEQEISEKNESPKATVVSVE